VAPDVIAYVAIHLRYDTTCMSCPTAVCGFAADLDHSRDDDHVRERPNVAVNQGPLQRWFGIANLSVETAGGGDGRSTRKKERRSWPRTKA